MTYQKAIDLATEAAEYQTTAYMERLDYLERQDPAEQEAIDEIYKETYLYILAQILQEEYNIIVD